MIYGHNNNMNNDSSDTRFGGKKNDNNNPSHFIVLDAIARGIKDIDSIAKATRLPREEVQLIVNDLSIQRLIIREEKKRFLGGKKLEIKVTETGLRMLDSKKQELQQQAEQLKQWHKNGNTTQLQSYMDSDSNRSWIPFMLLSGIMNAIFFTSMMSMVGMALNPMESQMTAESGGQGAAGTDTSGSTSADSSSSSQSADSQVGDTSDTGGGDFGGFDGGGFGDF
jgi:hypothetical protein